VLDLDVLLADLPQRQREVAELPAAFAHASQPTFAAMAAPEPQEEPEDEADRLCRRL
jgi:hypothetical protein